MTHLVEYFAELNRSSFKKNFLSFVNSILTELELEFIAIDGKTMKQYYDRNNQQKALHIVTA
jgi:hypothetical protein